MQACSCGYCSRGPLVCHHSGGVKRRRTGLAIHAQPHQGRHNHKQIHPSGVTWFPSAKAYEHNVTCSSLCRCSILCLHCACERYSSLKPACRLCLLHIVYFNELGSLMCVLPASRADADLGADFAEPQKEINHRMVCRASHHGCDRWHAVHAAAGP